MMVYGCAAAPLPVIAAITIALSYIHAHTHTHTLKSPVNLSAHTRANELNGIRM